MDPEFKNVGFSKLIKLKLQVTVSFEDGNIGELAEEKEKRFIFLFLQKTFLPIVD